VAEPPVRAFLNGGPWDGKMAVLPPYRMIYVAGGLGYYEARIDASGQLVPHDVEYVEFDWVEAS
jgi:hypothetical protein